MGCVQGVAHDNDPMIESKLEELVGVMGVVPADQHDARPMAALLLCLLMKPLDDLNLNLAVHPTLLQVTDAESNVRHSCA